MLSHWAPTSPSGQPSLPHIYHFATWSIDIGVVRAENTLVFSSEDARQHNSSEGDAAVILILTDWRRGEETARYKATIRVSRTTLTMTDKFGAKNQTFLKKFDAETRSLFILLVTDLF